MYVLAIMLTEWLLCYHSIHFILFLFIYLAGYLYGYTMILSSVGRRHQTVVKAKVAMQSLSGAGIWTEKIGESFDSDLLKSCSICGIPNCVVGLALSAELGQQSFQTWSWLKTFSLKGRLIQSNIQEGHLDIVREDSLSFPLG